MSEFKFEPKPPKDIPNTWQGLLEAALKKEGWPGMQGNRCLQGYWESAIEDIEEEDGVEFASLGHPDHGMRALQKSIDSLICNLQDMPKEDAITTLVDLYAEGVL